MPLEATMLVVDNSEYMRNGDYLPTRFDAMCDAINIVFQTKIDANPENTVGIVSMAAKSPEVLVTQTKEIGHILKATHSASISGQIDIPTSIAIAQLALKHRENKNCRQRIIVFVASPLLGPAADEKNMLKLAKKLKKNNVAVDIVCFGDGIEEGENSILKAFVDAASSSENSHLVSVPPGSHLISDAILSSPILSADRGIPDEALGDPTIAAATSAPGATTGDFDVFNVDPSLDPELAMALRMSMQEARLREDAEQASATAASTAAVAVAPPSQPTVVPATPTEDEQASLLQSSGDVQMAAADDDEEMDEEEAIARAIEMSMAEEQDEKK